MMMRYIKIIIAVILLLAALILSYCNSKLRENNKILSNNIEALYDGLEKRNINDSLNAVTIAELRFTKDELLRRHSEDKELIKQLTKNAKLQSYKNIEIVKFDTIHTHTYDTILYKDDSANYKDSFHIPDSVKAFNYTSEWTDVSGIIFSDSINLKIANRESLVITESLEKKKLWFIKLPVKIFGYKNKRVDVVSKNPNTHIQSVEYINIYE